MRKIICILAALTVMCTMTGTGVFAANDMNAEQPAENDPVAVQEEIDAAAEDAEGVTEESAAEEEPAATEEPQVDVNKKGVAGDQYTVTFDPAGGTMAEEDKTQIITEGETGPGYATEPAAPTKTNYTFMGWKLGGTAYDFINTPVTSNITLVAAWKFSAKAPAKPKKVKVYASYKSTVVTWSKVEGANWYRIYRSKAGKKAGKFKAKSPDSPKPYKIVKGNVRSFTDKKVDMYKYYDYQVVAVKRIDDENGVHKLFSDPVTVKRKGCVTQMYIQVTLKINKTLTSHDKAKKTRKFKKGTKIKTTGYNGYGKFIFYYKGNRFFVSQIACKKVKAAANPSRKSNYSPKEAEYFINARGTSSKTKYLIWVNQYDQHLYYFKGSKGKWKHVDNWEVSTGKVVSPTATGDFQIYKRMSMHHSLPKWNVFKGEQALHGCFSSWRSIIGRMASGGCVRNYNENVAKLWKLPMKTRVVIY